MALKLKESPLQKLSLENVYFSFTGLAPREKIIALVGMAVLLLLLLFLPFSLVSGKVHTMQRQVAETQDGYREVVTKIGELRAVQGEIRTLESRLGRAGSITSRVEGAAKKAGVTVSQLKEKPPQEGDYWEINSAEVNVSGASLQQAIDFLDAIENDPAVLMRFRRIQIKPKFANRQLLDLSCEIATYSMKGEPS